MHESGELFAYRDHVGVVEQYLDSTGLLSLIDVEVGGQYKLVYRFAACDGHTEYVALVCYIVTVFVEIALGNESVKLVESPGSAIYLFVHIGGGKTEIGFDQLTVEVECAHLHEVGEVHFTNQIVDAHTVEGHLLDTA